MHLQIRRNYIYSTILHIIKHGLNRTASTHRSDAGDCGMPQMLQPLSKNACKYFFCILVTCFLFYDFRKSASEEINTVSSEHVKIDTVIKDTNEEYEGVVSCQNECYGEMNVIFLYQILSFFILLIYLSTFMQSIKKHLGNP